MIVDSCKNPETKQAIAIEYLEQLGVDPAVDVKSLVISHWHSDHIGGASQIVEKCESAQVFYSSALLREEFLTFVEAFANPLSVVDRQAPGPGEMANIIKLLEERAGQDANYSRAHMSPAIEGRVLYDRQNNGLRTEVRSLSPSDAAFTNAIQEFSSMIPALNEQRKVIPSPTSNRNAVAIWVNFANKCVLLGADLEETNEQHTGWSAIVNSATKPAGQADIFKIPHHGSITAHSDDVWSFMVSPEPLALCTTFSNSSLPTENDIQRIKNYTDDLYCTTQPKSKLPKRAPAVDKTMNDATKARRPLGRSVGHIQVRLDVNGNQTICANQYVAKL